MTAPATPAPPVPVLEPAAQRLAEETDPHPRIYELPLDQARALFDQIQSGDGVARPSIDEEWVEVDAGEWGTVRARIVRPKNATGCELSRTAARATRASAVRGRRPAAAAQGAASRAATEATSMVTTQSAATSMA